MVKESLLQYLRNSLLLLGIIVTALFSLVMVTVYNWGLDDASEYYLLQDAESAEILLKNDSPLPKNDFSKQFYLGFDNLPQAYLSAIEKDISLVGGLIQYFSVSVNDDFFYVIQYPMKHSVNSGPVNGLSVNGISVNRVSDALTEKVVQEKFLYVIHGFHLSEDEALPGISIFEASLMILLIVLLIMVLGALLIYARISKSIEALQAYSDQQHLNSRLDPVDKSGSDTPTGMQFFEIQEFAGKLREAVQCVHEQSRKERAFIQALSHELRTPMAITGVALDILQKKTFDEKIQQKLQKIRLANNSMVALTNALLSIWHNEKAHSVEQINVSVLVKEITDDLLGLPLFDGMRDDMCFELNVPQGLTMNVCLSHFKIILENICKNALQYCGNGAIFINVNEESLTVTNEILVIDEDSKHAEKKWVSSIGLQQDYGYGLGLYIARQAALNQGWQLTVNESASQYGRKEFIARLVFKPTSEG